MLTPPPCVLYKQGVIISLAPIAQKGFGRVAKLYFDNNEDLIVTSGREGTHMPGSFHFIDMAWDQRKGSLRKADLLAVLGQGWQVIEYDTHYHCEYDNESK